MQTKTSKNLLDLCHHSQTATVGQSTFHTRGVTPENLGRGVRPASQNPYPIYDQNGGKMAKIDTQFMTKTAEKPYPLGPHIPI